MAGRILIVDDIATNRIVLKVKLGSAQYETLQSATGAEAIAMAREARPDLILLDAELPDMTGAEVCTRLKEDPATRDIPVVMITACQDHARKIQALRAGALHGGHEVEFEATRHAQRLGDRLDTELIAVGADQADLTGPDSIIDSVLVALASYD